MLIKTEGQTRGSEREGLGVAHGSRELKSQICGSRESKQPFHASPTILSVL